jgi:hypothetical protein
MTEQSIERLTARILEYQRWSVVVMGEREWPCRPRPIELRPERVFVLEPPESRGRWIFRKGRDNENTRQTVA